jgi:hypothetical protein
MISKKLTIMNNNYTECPKCGMKELDEYGDCHYCDYSEHGYKQLAQDEERRTFDQIDQNEGGYDAPLGEYYPANHIDPMYDYL